VKGERDIGGLDQHPGLEEHHAVLDHVLQLPDVPAPEMIAQRALCLIAEPWQ
jgi:hypothetical protein